MQLDSMQTMYTFLIHIFPLGKKKSQFRVYKHFFLVHVKNKNIAPGIYYSNEWHVSKQYTLKRILLI